MFYSGISFLDNIVAMEFDALTKFRFSLQLCMIIRKDFRIQLPDEPGQLSRICEALSTRGVNIRTIAGIAGTPSILAIISDNEEETRKVLDALNLVYEQTDLLLIKFQNIPGEIAIFSKRLAEKGINISAVYMLGETSGKGMIAFGVSDLDKAQKIAEQLVETV